MRVLISTAGVRGATLGQMAAELDDDTIDAHAGLRPALESLGRAVAEQLNTAGRMEHRGRVVGVELTSLDFVVLLG